MKGLLSELDKTAGKTAYQTYKIRHGIETFEVLVDSVIENKQVSKNIKTHSLRKSCAATCRKIKTS